ncbi:MAG: helix-turn-helix transcriptional regulator [Sphingobium sp.]|nr:helix-turn-helix transcriptional regulator [Sphingobium sp.]MBP6112501.1 helix-turn-helix transcriptional regulator [Sphingobium sp.]MBP8670067.1 helix-turn-helix transcriptional regulator [Sphingobium sp.]MBP9157428.1 helix-turn-helix transcriptional regulator [Sphingobium sp.]MCC6482382.1 helix-turn-helix transcriptional regulator [Sphingomonadaceae bacterium]
MTVQIIEIAGQKMAMLPIDDYQRLLDVAEDREDVLDAMAAEKRRIEGEEYLPAEMVDRILNGESALKIWRKYRGMTLDQLAVKAETKQSMLSMIETGQRRGSPVLWRALADAMGVSVDDILPFD